MLNQCFLTSQLCFNNLEVKGMNPKMGPGIEFSGRTHALCRRTLGLIPHISKEKERKTRIL